MIILRNTNNNIFVSVSDVTDKHNIYLGLFTKLLFARLIAIYSSLTICSMFPSTYICKPWLLLCYVRVLFHQLASPPGFLVTHIPKGSLVYVYMLCFISLMMSSYLFEMIGSWPHVAMVVVLVCPHFPSLRYILCLSPSWCPHIPAFTTTSYIHYCCTDSCSVFFPVENGGSSWHFWEPAIGEKGQLEVKDEKENMPLVDRVKIVTEVYGAVCQLYSILWNTWQHKSSEVTKHI